MVPVLHYQFYTTAFRHIKLIKRAWTKIQDGSSHFYKIHILKLQKLFKTPDSVQSTNSIWPLILKRNTISSLENVTPNLYYLNLYRSKNITMLSLVFPPLFLGTFSYQIINLRGDEKVMLVTKRKENVANTSWLQAKHYFALFLCHRAWNFKAYITRCAVCRREITQDANKSL